MVNKFMSVIQKSDLLDVISKKALFNKARVAIGLDIINETIMQSIERAHYMGYADVLLVGDANKVTNFNYNIPIINTNNPAKCIVDLLISGKVDAVVRGNVSSSLVLEYLKTNLNLDKLHRIALLSKADGIFFLFSPVGIDEGNNLNEKIKIVQLAAKLLHRFNIMPHVGIISGGRIGDIGRSRKIDSTLADGEFLSNYFNNMGIHTKHYTILIEDAIKEANIILAPDGVSGNLIFRTLIYLGCGESMGAPFMLDKYVFVDTSRAKVDYTNAIMLASALVDFRD